MTSNENIVVGEGNAPLLTFQGKTQLADGSLVPYLLSGAPAIVMVAKLSRNDVDGSAVFTYSIALGQIAITADGTVVGAKYSEFTVQVVAADTAVPRNLFYRIDVVKAGKPDTIKKGYFLIENT